MDKITVWKESTRKIFWGVQMMVAALLVVGLAACGDAPQPITFDTYEVMDDIQVSIDIPQGNGVREQNVMKALCEIIAGSDMCSEAIGAPIEGTIQEIIADCQKRYRKYGDDFVKESGAPGPPVCQLFIESGYQNEACVTFQVDDGVYFNGSPDTYFRVIRFSDGYMMALEEMVNISEEVLQPLLEKYNQDVTPIFLGDGFYFTPAANDSVRAIWTIGHGWGDAMIPLSEMEPYMTEAGRELFTAKAFEIPAKSEQTETESEQTDTSEAENETGVSDDNPGLFGLLPEGTTEFTGDMAGFPIEMSITKEGKGLRAFYKNIKYKATMKLESDARSDNEGNTTFWGDDARGNQWKFHLGGNENYVCGYAEGDGKSLQVVLFKK